MPGRPHVCVVGHGVAGRLHRQLLEGMGLSVSVVDPAAPRHDTPVATAATLTELPADRPVDVWSVCTPTAAHVHTVAAVLDRDPEARVLVEKPACRSWEGPELSALLDAHDRARLVVMNQYAHAKAPAILEAVRAEFAPRHPVRAVRVAFCKDRREDIAAGRFVDLDYGVFGYEWLHMLAVLGSLLPAPAFDRYLRDAPAPHAVRIARDPRLASTAAHETTTLRTADGSAVEIELYSTITGPDAPHTAPAPAWARRTGPATDSRLRLARVEAGPVVLTLELDPVFLPNGTRLPRNTHRLTLDGPGGHREWLVPDSPMDNALRHAVATLLGPGPRPPLDLRPLGRIGRLARLAARTDTPADAPHTAPTALPTRL
ncbi:Gfo/Idh/MocA family oxidoreductase [Streptomyces mobaraensis]|uniref:Gfo/Idh/MocA family oxidoreductase n=1 Tax=Streptomyces mobaraensis TaxID=35621 RepID=UPI001F0464CC|nr:Gfo/Idh/MocA family oxidoreductase [Streptomyces mobaraensis]